MTLQLPNHYIYKNPVIRQCI